MHYSRSHGFSLIEVLIALAVLAVGFAAIAKFQATVFGYSAVAKERAVAARLAEEKIADLRHYETLPATTGEIAYQNIGGNTGGVIPSGMEEISKVTYTRHWTVVDYFYPDPTITGQYGVPASITPPTPTPAFPSFKLVTVTIGWTDRSAAAQSVAVRSIINASDPLYSGRILE